MDTQTTEATARAEAEQAARDYLPTLRAEFRAVTPNDAMGWLARNHHAGRD